MPRLEPAWRAVQLNDPMSELDVEARVTARWRPIVDGWIRSLQVRLAPIVTRSFGSVTWTAPRRIEMPFIDGRADPGAEVKMKRTNSRRHGVRCSQLAPRLAMCRAARQVDEDKALTRTSTCPSP